MQSLYGRFTLAFLAAFFALAAAAFVGIERFTRLYRQEATQRLNRDLAAWIVSHYGFEPGARLDTPAIERIFHDAMNVNPTIELYLLDTQGEIRAFNAPPDSVRSSRVDMAPLRAYFRNPDRLPVLGDDPRHPGQRRLFSVAPIGPPEAMDGYLYVVIGGEQYEGLLSRFRASHVLRVSLYLALGILLAAAAWALLSFALVTRRIRRLGRSLTEFRAAGFARVPAGLSTAAAGDPRGDELDRLADDLCGLMDLTVQHLQRLRDVDNRLREMIASLSHDLRTPLASLGCSLESLLLKQDSQSSEERRSHLQIAVRQQDRLQRLVGALFELAQLELPDARCELQPTAVPDLLMDVAQRFGPRAEELGLAIQTECPDHMPLALADAALLERALENLIDNALRHTPRGGRIRLSSEHAAGRVRLSVLDSGAGVPAEHLPRIFERFYRADPSRRDPRGGAGLGLAITQRIAELHGGRLFVKSRPGIGSVFSLTLRTAG